MVTTFAGNGTYGSPTSGAALSARFSTFTNILYDGSNVIACHTYNTVGYYSKISTSSIVTVVSAPSNSAIYKTRSCWNNNINSLVAAYSSGIYTVSTSGATASATLITDISGATNAIGNIVPTVTGGYMVTNYFHGTLYNVSTVLPATSANLFVGTGSIGNTDSIVAVTLNNNYLSAIGLMGDGNYITNLNGNNFSSVIAATALPPVTASAISITNTDGSLQLSAAPDGGNVGVSDIYYTNTTVVNNLTTVYTTSGDYWLVNINGTTRKVRLWD